MPSHPYFLIRILFYFIFGCGWKSVYFTVSVGFINCTWSKWSSMPSSINIFCVSLWKLVSGTPFGFLSYIQKVLYLVIPLYSFLIPGRKTVVVAAVCGHHHGPLMSWPSDVSLHFDPNPIKTSMRSRDLYGWPTTPKVFGLAAWTTVCSWPFFPTNTYVCPTHMSWLSSQLSASTGDWAYSFPGAKFGISLYQLFELPVCLFIKPVKVLLNHSTTIWSISLSS